MKNLNDLFYFAKVVEYGGFSNASNALGLTKSLLSRRVSELENRLAVKLLNRSNRKVTVTDVGKIYYQYCKAIIIEAEAADEAIEKLTLEPTGTVKISCPINLLHINIGQILNKFLKLYPKVKLHIEATNRKVDLINECYDIAIRIRPMPLKDSDLILRKLAISRQFIVGSPSFLHQHFSIKTPEELSKFPILMMESFISEHSWNLFNSNQDSFTVKLEPRITTTDLNTLHLATLEGLGVSKLPEQLITKDLEEGRLIRVIPEWEPTPELIHLVYTSRRGLLPSVKALIDFLINEFNNS